ncbi:MAG: cobalt-precorrin-5B (C(1))-methyltransferase CbiD [Phormidium tanganyikae FI6-MK23]|jgi:cobalt-precorrin-5B (C1)-methyltransferase|nr:cobalt-precorrin-5B (C(1))-methyltransferase CbiD [Phormidium tanganyikae FI6-MK23]
MKSGYTLPVFACASAIAALQHLRHGTAIDHVELDLINPVQVVEISIEQVAKLTANSALAITRSDPGDNLDLTRNTPIWAMVELSADDANAAIEAVESPLNPPFWETLRSNTFRLQNDSQLSKSPIHGGLRGQKPPETQRPLTERITIIGGEGIGIRSDQQSAIYAYAQQLLLANLERLLHPGESLRVTLILPEGRQLAKRTSNEAFGVVEGLSLLGTSGIAHPLSAPDQLELFRAELQQKSKQFDTIVFCIGENGLDLAAKMGIDRDRTLKTANWIGSLLVEAGMQHVKSILLFGYHGKLIKLAGGIFHTHHHVADARQEILTAHAAKVGMSTPDLQAILTSATAEDGLKYLRNLGSAIAVYNSIAQTIDDRAQHYIYTHSEATVEIGTILFDRSRQILVKSKKATQLLESIC